MGFLRLGNLGHDEEAYLRDNTHSFVRLTQKHGSSAFVCKLLARSFAFSIQILIVFLLSLQAFTLENRHLALAALAVVIAIVCWRTLQVIVLFAGVHAGKLHQHVYGKSLIYFAWWPVHGFWLCLVAALLGGLLGNYIWTTRLEPYRELKALQTYGNVNTEIIPGQQLQDAGLVGFAPNVAVDRGRGGCFMGGGHTYCVAPIIYGGRLLDGLAGSPRTGEYDYFAVGVDCCTCPNREFKCGQWDNPFARGGVRSLDKESRPFFQLAVNDWEASYRKNAGHPLFFQWVEDPVRAWNGLYTWANSATFGACVIVTFASFALGIFLGKLLQWLVVQNIASHSCAPVPPAGFEKAWAWLLPELHHYSVEERRQLLAMPVGPAPWYAPPTAGAHPAATFAPRLRTTEDDNDVAGGGAIASNLRPWAYPGLGSSAGFGQGSGLPPRAAYDVGPM
eukprot:TRINITY_DN26847_c0_g4_i1.p1 TRINITY_DN26847_c0_g4~~TRINITY_DN26847_c0_g4_i1.p1  ORF type:complete len:448 (-),score=86.21 TRINITY_DN26847_c0_g4_i1:69-1412(-)